MTCNTKVYTPRAVEGYGTLGHYATPAVFIDGMLQPAPKGWTIPPCYLGNAGGGGPQATLCEQIAALPQGSPSPGTTVVGFDPSNNQCATYPVGQLVAPPSNVEPLADRVPLAGGASTGLSLNYARADHIHPIVRQLPVNHLASAYIDQAASSNVQNVTPTIVGPVRMTESEQIVVLRVEFSCRTVGGNSVLSFVQTLASMSLLYGVFNGLHDPTAPIGARQSHPAIFTEGHNLRIFNARSANTMIAHVVLVYYLEI